MHQDIVQCYILHNRQLHLPPGCRLSTDDNFTLSTLDEIRETVVVGVRDDVADIGRVKRAFGEEDFVPFVERGDDGIHLAAGHETVVWGHTDLLHGCVSI